MVTAWTAVWVLILRQSGFGRWDVARLLESMIYTFCSNFTRTMKPKPCASVQICLPRMSFLNRGEDVPLREEESRRPPGGGGGTLVTGLESRSRINIFSQLPNPHFDRHTHNFSQNLSCLSPSCPPDPHGRHPILL
jgi:hypothetical protein